MKDFIKTFLMNPSIKYLLFSLLLIPLWGWHNGIDPSKISFILSVVIFVVLIYNLIVTLFYTLDKRYKEYENLAKLIKYIRKLEYKAEILGGKGKGLYEKIASIDDRFSPDIIDTTLEVATIRNNAIHGEPKIDNLDNVIKKIKYIEYEIDKRIAQTTKKRYIFFFITIMIYFGLYFYYIKRYSFLDNIGIFFMGIVIILFIFRINIQTLVKFIIYFYR